MTYETLLAICQLASLLIFGAMMTGIFIYALRPSNKARFDAAASMALRDDQDVETTNGR
jgi:cytochrome c oxidase cbb3-type subunit IV